MKHINIETHLVNTDVQIVCLNRPEVKNAFHPEMIFEITEYFKTTSTSESVKLIILKGHGSVFCSGADLNWMQDMVNYSLAENISDSEKLWEMFEAIENCPIPVVSVVHGAVFGGALGLLSSSDYVFTEENTQFCFSEVKLGLVPAIISGFISKKIQDAFYRPLMLSAEIFNAKKAQHIGLAHEIFTEKIDTNYIINKFSNNGLAAMKETKKLLNQLINKNSEINHKKICTQVISERRVSEEGQFKLKTYLSKALK